MLFAEALQKMKEGKCLVRENWPAEEGYLVVMKGMTTVWKILTDPKPNAGNHLFTVEEYEANDWKVLE